VLGAFDRKLVDRVMVYHLWDAVKRLAELAEDVMAASAATAIVTAHDLHMHEATRTPGQQSYQLISHTNSLSLHPQPLGAKFLSAENPPKISG